MPATRSISCMTPAASSGGKASSRRKDVTSCAHTKKGNRMKVSPLARSWIVVVMKLTRAKQRRGDQEDHPDEPPRLTRTRDAGQRRVRGPSGLRGPAGDEEAAEHRDAAEEEAPVADHVDLREGHVRGADLEREHEVPESADGERDHAEEDHDGAVHRPELVVELREHRPARHARLTEEVADQRQRGARVGQVPAHQHHQREAEEQEQHAGDGVLDADHLVIGREDVLPPEAELLVMDLVRDVRMWCGDDLLVTHRAASPITLRHYFAPGTANLKS